MISEITLISHNLCPYVQRVAIVLEEKSLPFVRRDVDLINKPKWFLEMSPLSKTPVLNVDGQALFESSVICEYLEDAYPHSLHPKNPLERARHRSWMEFSSIILNNIAGFYLAPNDEQLEHKRQIILQQFHRLNNELYFNPYFSGDNFSMVDAFFAPVFRYFDVFEKITNFNFFDNYSKVIEWRNHLMLRDSVKRAVTPDYPERLYDFLRRKKSALSLRMLN